MARRRVLIVEDEFFQRTVTRNVLQAAGYEVAEAADGTEGLAKAESLRPDVILLDVVMPGPDGYDVCQRLKANPATTHIPVIFTTAVENLALNRIAVQAGATVCIAKPLRPDALAAAIEAVLSKPAGPAEPEVRDDWGGP